MDKLEKFISKTIKEILKPDEFAFRLIENKLQATGIVLTKEQKLQVKKQLDHSAFDSFHITLTKEQEKSLGGANKEHIILDLGSEDEFNELESHIRQAIGNATQEVLSSISRSLLDAWKSQSSSLLRQQNVERVGHAKLIDETWARPLDLLEILLSVSLEAGAAFNEYYRPIAAKENDIVFEVLTELHARGCQVGFEALLLLRNGFADGAHARWRTLHELCVEACFIAQHGNNVAERFLYHSGISDYKMALLYKDYHQALGYAPPKQEAIDAVKKEKDKLLNHYGKPFYYDYGWAYQALNKKGNRPTFVDLEKSVGLEHLRPFYKLANMNVHSGSKGAAFRLGLPLNNDNLLVAGASIYGLGEPGQNVAFSFHHLTATLLLTRKNLDRIAFISATLQLMNEIVWAFDEVMQSQENTGK